jgi:hypothetical protein
LRLEQARDYRLETNFGFLRPASREPVEGALDVVLLVGDHPANVHDKIVQHADSRRFEVMPTIILRNRTPSD